MIGTRDIIALSGAIVSLVGILNCIFLDVDPTHSAMVITTCATLFGGILTVYVGSKAVEAHYENQNK